MIGTGTAAQTQYRHRTLFTLSCDCQAGLIPFAVLACWIDSTVWFMTPSSAATTRITMSVALAPRALMEEKAAWPGVSRKVIFSPVGSWTGRENPQCDLQFFLRYKYDWSDCEIS